MGMGLRRLLGSDIGRSSRPLPTSGPRLFFGGSDPDEVWNCAQDNSNNNHPDGAGNEVGIDHQDQPATQWNKLFLAFAVHEEGQADRAEQKAPGK